MCLPALAAAIPALIISGLQVSTATSVTGAVIGGLSAAATVATAGLQIAGEQAASDAAQEQAKYEYQVAEYEAELERQRGEVDQLRFGINARKEHGALVARAAASNFDLSSGSPSTILTESIKFQTFDSAILARSTEARVLGLKLRGQQALAEGKNAQLAGQLGIAGIGISAVGQSIQVGRSLSDVGVFDFSRDNTNAKFSGGAASNALSAPQRVQNIFRPRAGLGQR